MTRTRSRARTRETAALSALWFVAGVLSALAGVSVWCWRAYRQEVTR